MKSASCFKKIVFFVNIFVIPAAHDAEEENLFPILIIKRLDGRKPRRLKSRQRQLLGPIKCLNILRYKRKKIKKKH